MLKNKVAYPLIDSLDIYLFNEGTHCNAYKFFGAREFKYHGKKGVKFCVWAPKAKKVALISEFNNWTSEGYEFRKIDPSGIWSLFVEGMTENMMYKYEITSLKSQKYIKSDPFSFYSQKRPNVASIVKNLDGYEWKDYNWKKKQELSSNYSRPINIYEVHLGSWKTDEDGNFLNYKEIAKKLVKYVKEMKYTHIEIMPIMEHPLDESWGYQLVGYYSATSRYGEPKDFMYFVDLCHQNDIGVILDWVPGHFCKDFHGLHQFDGSCVYEYKDPLKSEHPHWGTANFDLGKPQVKSFLISNAFFWFEYFHIDGIRVDAVASMLYLDYGREGQNFSKNKFGGNQNLEAINFIKELNLKIFESFPYALMMAEESTSWPLVTSPTYLGGLGFNFKWNMGWMNDILRYMQQDPIHKKWHHNLATFSFSYAFSENYLLPLSHDEVVHGKKSLIEKMPGDYFSKFENLKTLYGFMMAHPGKKLLFMGGEYGQFSEWNEKKGLEWFLLDYPAHKSLHNYVKALNSFYLENKEFWEMDCSKDGFCWVDPSNYNDSILIFKRMSKKEEIYAIFNFTPIPRSNYLMGVDKEGEYQVVFNSSWEQFGGKIKENKIKTESQPIAWHYREFSVNIDITGLSAIFIKKIRDINPKIVEIKTLKKETFGGRK